MGDFSRFDTQKGAFLAGTLAGLSVVIDRAIDRNLAIVQSYTKDRQPSASYPDTNGVEFTDGLVGSAYTDGRSFGYTYAELGFPSTGGTGVVNITVDLKEIKWVKAFRLVSGSGSGASYEADVLEILTSTDNVSYTSRGSVGSLGTPTRTLNLTPATPVQARYVRFRCSKQMQNYGSGRDWFFFDEGYVFESEDSHLEPATGSNIAGGRSYAKSHAPSSSYPDTGNAEFTDGLEGNTYSDGRSFGYLHSHLGVADGAVGTLEIVVDLGSNRSISSAKLASGSGPSDAAAKYEADTLEILTSTDNVNWTSQGSTGSLNNPQRYLTVNFAPVTARYVKFRIQKDFTPLSASYGNWLFIMEGYIYEAASGTFTSPELDISTVGTVGESLIAWNKAGNVSVETRYSLDGGGSWSSWAAASSGSSIAGLAAGTNVSNGRLQYRATLISGSPQAALHDVTIFVGDQTSLNEWATWPAMPTARTYAATDEYNGKAYVFGGTVYYVAGQPEAVTGKLEIFDPATREWATGTSMPTPRTGCAIGQVGGVFYLIEGRTAGGVYSTANEAFDAAAGTWTSKASAPASLVFPRGVVHGGIVYVMGGGDSSNNASARNDAYNPSNNTRPQKANLPVAQWAAGPRTIGSLIYLAGGWTGATNLARTDAYDPASDTYTAKANMPEGRRDYTGAAAGGKLYCCDGFVIQTQTNYGDDKKTVIFDPVANAWSTGATMRHSRIYGGGANLGGKVVVIGGLVPPQNSGEVYLSSNIVEALDAPAAAGRARRWACII